MDKFELRWEHDCFYDIEGNMYNVYDFLDDTDIKSLYDALLVAKRKL